MDAVALLRRAQEVGLRVEPMGDRLVVRGPKRSALDAEVQERSFKFLDSSAPSGAWLLKSRLTFCWLRDTSEQRRLRE